MRILPAVGALVILSCGSPVKVDMPPDVKIEVGSPFPNLACISHYPTAEARDMTARTSLRLLAVLNVLFKYACARQAARASS